MKHFVSAASDPALFLYMACSIFWEKGETGMNGTKINPINKPDQFFVKSL